MKLLPRTFFGSCALALAAAISWRHGKRLSAYYVPLQVLSDWATALTKLWVVFHPAKQNWLNRGARTLNTTRGSTFYSLRTTFAHYLYGFSCVALMAVIGLLVGFVPLVREARLFLHWPPPAIQQAETTSDSANLQTPPLNEYQRY